MPASEALCFALVQIPCTPRDEDGRRRVRSVLKQILTNWAGYSPEWIESTTGPSIPESFLGAPLHFSISYANASAWLAISRVGSIGVDAVAVKDFAELEDVASLFLDATARQEMRAHEDKAFQFAKHWARLEARCKKARIPLIEGVRPPMGTTLEFLADSCVISLALE
jgi:phosphopantetheinyl transferase